MSPSRAKRLGPDRDTSRKGSARSPQRDGGGGEPPAPIAVHGAEQVAGQRRARGRRGHLPRRAQPARPRPLEVRRCNVCRQVLPEGYQAPTDKPWTTGIFGCAEDPQSCWTGLFCPCVLFGRNAESLTGVPWTRPCTCHAVCVEGGIALAVLAALLHGVDPGISYLIGEGVVCGWLLSATYTGYFRQELQKKYHLKNSPCDHCLVHCCLHWCANCQEHRERNSRLADHTVVPVTIANPPPVQEMSKAENPLPTMAPENEARKTERATVELTTL